MKFINHKVVAIGLLALLFSLPSVLLAHDHQSMKEGDKTKNKASDIMIHMPWARALPPVATNGAAYLMVHNNGNTDDRIIEIKSPIAGSVMMHKSIQKNGSLHMKHVPNLPVKARGMVQFKPGGLHVMLMGLKKPLVSGESFPITVVMEQAGEITGMVKITKNKAGKKDKHNHQH